MKKKMDRYDRPRIVKILIIGIQGSVKAKNKGKYK